LIKPENSASKPELKLLERVDSKDEYGKTAKPNAKIQDIQHGFLPI
jgi:hypothetical protein